MGECHHRSVTVATGISGRARNGNTMGRRASGAMHTRWPQKDTAQDARTSRRSPAPIRTAVTDVRAAHPDDCDVLRVWLLQFTASPLRALSHALLHSAPSVPAGRRRPLLQRAIADPQASHTVGQPIQFEDQRVPPECRRLLWGWKCEGVSVHGECDQGWNTTQPTRQHFLDWQTGGRRVLARDDSCVVSSVPCSLCVVLFLPSRSSLCAQSTLFSGTPTNTLLLNFNSPPTNFDSGRFNFTLLSYTLNGTSFNPSTNVTPIYYRSGFKELIMAVDANLNGNNNQKYTFNLALDEGLTCGSISDHTVQFAQTRCVLRYVYDGTSTNSNSRVSCADVVIVPRSWDVAVPVTVRIPNGDVPIGTDTAMRRLLNSDWVQQAALMIDLFQTPAQTAAGNNDITASQIRYANPPFTVGGNAYVMNFIFSATTSRTALALAQDFYTLGTDGLSTLFDLQVIGAGSGNAAAGAASPVAALIVAIAAVGMALAQKL